MQSKNFGVNSLVFASLTIKWCTKSNMEAELHNKKFMLVSRTVMFAWALESGRIVALI